MTSINADGESANDDVRSMSLYNSKEASAFFADMGLPISSLTLDKLRSVGGGPDFRRFGKYALYERQSLLDWAHARLSDPVRSTSFARKSILSPEHLDKLRKGRQALLADPECRQLYARAASQGHKASWADPEKHAARVEKMRATRARHRAEKENAEAGE